MQLAIEEDLRAWLTRGRSGPDPLFSSAAGTPLDLSHISFGLTLDKAELIVAGFYQMRHTFGSPLSSRRFFQGIAFDGNRFNRTAGNDTTLRVLSYCCESRRKFGGPDFPQMEPGGGLA